MSNIPLLLLSNTFGEWLITVNNLLSEYNDSTSNGVSNTLAIYDGNGSLSFNQLSVNDLQINSGPTIDTIRTNYLQNNDTSIATTKATLDLLRGTTSVLVPIKAKSLTLGSVTADSILTSFNSTSTNSLVTSQSVYNLLTGTTTLNLPLKADSIQLGSGPVISNVNKNFNSFNDTSVVTSNAVMNLLTGSAILNMNLASLKLNSGTQVNKIATDFNSVDDTTLVTAKAVYNLFGGIDNDIGTIEGRSIDLGSAYIANNFAEDFSRIDVYSLASTFAVYDYLSSGNYSLNIVANTATLDVAQINDVLASNVSAELLTLNNYSVTDIESDFSIIDDHRLVTANAIYNMLTTGNLAVNAVLANTSIVELEIGGHSVNAISNVLDAANTNNFTLGTTQGIYDLLSGGVSTVPPLPISANSFSFPNGAGNTTVNSIATNFSTVNDNSLVTANAVYNLLTDGQVSLAVDFDSIELTNGITVNAISTTISGSAINHHTLGTTQAISDAITNGTGTIRVSLVETNDLYTYQGSVGNLPFGQSVSQGFSSLNNIGNFVSPYLYTAAIESYDRRGEISSSGILLSPNATTTTGGTVPADSLGLYTDGVLRLHIQNDGTLNAYDNDFVTTGNISSTTSDVHVATLTGNTTSTGQLVLHCEVNTHGQTIVPQPHSAGVTNILTLPAGSNQEIVGTTSTQTLSNKTLTDTLISGHLTPTADVTYDLGSANNRFRDIYLSSSSIWLGDEIKLDTSSGTAKFKKRDTNVLPNIINLLGGDSANAISHVNTTFNYNPAKTTLSELTSNDLLSYLKTFNNYQTATLYDLFPAEGSVYYNESDYSEILYQTTAGTIADTVNQDSNLVLVDYKESNKVILKNPTGNITLLVDNVTDAEGISLDIVAHVLQNTVAYDITTLNINGNNAVQLTSSGANTTPNALNTFDVKAVYLNNNWYATVLVR